MSGARKLHVLIVEDESAPIEAYEECFNDLRNDKIEFVGPKFVHSFEEATDTLKSIQRFHLVILDLCIPMKRNRKGNKPSIELGLQLLHLCITRESRPIPSVLIVTGYLDNRKLVPVQEELHREFVFAKELSKSDNATTEAEIRKALAKLHVFLGKNIECDEGVQLTPREEYLACRAAMELDVEGLHLFSPSSTQLEWFRNSPFCGAEASNLLIASPVLSNGNEAAQKWHFAFIRGEHDHLQSIEKQAKQWAHQQTGISSPLPIWSNKHGLFYFTLATTANVNRRPRKTQNIMGRKKDVLDLINSSSSAHADATKLIDDLGLIDARYRELHADMGYVAAILAKHVATPRKATFLTCKVGAFNAKKGAEENSEKWMSVYKGFFEARRPRKPSADRERIQN